MRAFVVDAFTDTAFRGNPAGVVFLDEDRSDAWRQSVAAEFRHSETAFVTRRADGDYDLRWFTPTTEIDLCGHATVATTHALHTSGAGDAFVFHTRSGQLRTSVSGADVTLDFPTASLEPSDVPGLADSLDTDVLALHVTGNRDVLALVADETVVANLRPDFDAVSRLPARGVIVTAAADVGRDYDFVSRFFAPGEGVDEDPVTGSAHCALTPFWADRLGRDVLTGVQLSERGGRIAVELRGDRVLLRGGAVTVLAGDLLV